MRAGLSLKDPHYKTTLGHFTARPTPAPQGSQKAVGYAPSRPPRSHAVSSRGELRFWSAEMFSARTISHQSSSGFSSGAV